jgi:DNA-binding CsgD family transcriptional regulator
LTERQREVLDLVAKGYTNFEIAQALGVSLEGAKYHIREILTRLGVETREEAAAIWQHELAPRVRVARWLGSVLSVPSLRLTAVVGGVAAVATAGVVVALAMRSGGEADIAEQTDATSTTTAITLAPTPPTVTATVVAAATQPPADAPCPFEPALCDFAAELQGWVQKADIVTVMGNSRPDVLTCPTNRIFFGPGPCEGQPDGTTVEVYTVSQAGEGIATSEQQFRDTVELYLRASTEAVADTPDAYGNPRVHVASLQCFQPEGDAGCHPNGYAIFMTFLHTDSDAPLPKNRRAIYRFDLRQEAGAFVIDGVGTGPVPPESVLIPLEVPGSLAAGIKGTFRWIPWRP